MCFTMGWLVSLLVWCVIVGAVIAIIKLILPLAIGWLGAPGTVLVQIVTIVFWAIVAILVIYVAFDLITCLLGAGGGLKLPGTR